MSPRAVVAGHICLDLMPELGSRAVDLRPGALRIAGPLTLSTGGSVSNTGIALHRLGVETRLVALIGGDPLGEVLRAALERESPGLGAGLVTRPGEATSYSVILSSAATDRIVVHHPGANDSFGCADVSPDRLAGGELLHVGYPPLMRRLCAADGTELVALVRVARSLGLVTSLDMAEPDERVGDVDWRRLLARVMTSVDLFLPSLAELEAMLAPAIAPADRWDGSAPPPEGELRSLAEAVIELGAAVVAIKLGRFGLYLRTARADRIDELAERLPGIDRAAWCDRELWAPIFEVEVRGTTGSGDTTIAGFIAALLDRARPEAALDLACAVGSLCVEADDALSGIRDRAQAVGRVHSTVRRSPPPVSDPWQALPGSAIAAGPNDAWRMSRS